MTAFCSQEIESFDPARLSQLAQRAADARPSISKEWIESNTEGIYQRESDQNAQSSFSAPQEVEAPNPVQLEQLTKRAADSQPPIPKKYIKQETQ